MFKCNLPKGIMLFAVAAVLILPLYTFFFLSPQFVGLITSNLEREAIRVATHMQHKVFENGMPAGGLQLPPAGLPLVEHMREDFGLMKVRFFNAAGTIIYSTDPAEQGTLYRKDHFHQIVARGRTFTKLVENGQKTMEGATDQVNVMETYLPLMQEGVFRGAIEIYYDTTAALEQLERLKLQFYFTLYPIVIFLLAGIMISSLRACRSLSRSQEMEEKVRLAYNEMEMRVEERTVELKVALANLEEEVGERRLIEDELRKSESQLKTIFESTATGITLSDLNGKPIRTNQAFQKMVGYSDEELRHMHFSDLTYPEDRGGNKLRYQEMLAGERSHFHMTKRYVHKSGRVVWGQLTVSPILDEEGKPLMIVGMVEDISIRRQLEEERLKSSKLESIGVLASGLAHDFNNLLTAIMGNISLARMVVEPGGQAHERLAASEKALTMARGLTRQLLTLSKDSEPRKKTIDIGELLRNESNFALSGSRVKCEFELAPDLWPAEVDQIQMGRVIHNLLLNAKDAMPEGGVVLVRGENVVLDMAGFLPLPAGNYIAISVIDEGVGIDKDILSRIFDPYFSTKQTGAQKGTGLGLAICHSVVKRHGGHIEVETGEGKKTTFKIYLPAAEVSAVESPLPAPAAVKTAEAAASPGLLPEGVRKRILLMDDEETILEVTVSMLDYLGYEVATALDGEGALSRFLQAKQDGRPFDLVVLDLTIRGGMGGEEVVQKLLEIEPGVKAVVASGYADDPVMANYLRYGFVAAIGKPFTIESLGEIIQQALS